MYVPTIIMLDGLGTHGDCEIIKNRWSILTKQKISSHTRTERCI
jgi:hypothetical protein